MTEPEQTPRSGGPPLVTSGPTGAPAIVVLDPAGAAKHDDVPASWHPMLWHHQVAWCRVPNSDALAAADQRLDDLAARRLTVDLLTCGPLAEIGFLLARRWAAAVRSLLLVDPAAPDERFATEDADLADTLWRDRVDQQVAQLTDAGVTVRVIAHSSGDERDRIPPPMPLGHPDVVKAVREAITELDAA